MAKATGARSELTYSIEGVYGTTNTVNGTASGATTDATGYAIGSTSITMAAAGTGTIIVGDLISFAGDTRQYPVLTGDTDVSNGGTVVLKAPGLLVAIPTSATAITVAPAPAMTVIPRTGGTPNMSKEVFESADIRSDRQRSDMRHGWRSAALPLACELRHGEYDQLFESAMYSAWVADVLKIGTTETSFSFQTAFKDIGRFHVMTGGVVNETSFSIKPDSIVTCTFTLVGKDMTVSAVDLDAAPAPAGTTEPFDALTGTISEGGGSIAIVTGLDFSISNSIEATKAIGAAVAAEQIEGLCAVTGTVTAYFENDTLLEKFINETSSSISVTLTDPASNTLTFDFPNVLYTGGEVALSGTGPVTLSMPFTALYDATEATTIKITRS